MARTSVIVFPDVCGAVVIARSEGEAPLSPADGGQEDTPQPDDEGRIAMAGTRH